MKKCLFLFSWLLSFSAGCGGSGSGLSPIGPVLDSLRGLPFDEFLEKSFEQFLRRNPETVFWFGLERQFGMHNDRLDDVSVAYVEQTFDLVDGMKSILEEFVREQLSPDEQITYDAYHRFLDVQAAARPYLAFDYPINYYSGLEQATLGILNDSSWIESRRDAEDQIERMWQAGRKLRQAVARAEYCESRGAVLPRFALDWTLYYAREVADAEPQDLYMYWQFAAALDDLAGLGEADRENLLQQAHQAIGGSVTPGFKAVVAHLERIEPSAPDGIGLSQFPGGAAAYGYLLLFHTDSDLDAEAIHQLGLQEAARLQEEMAGRFQALGYPAGESLSESFARVADDGGSVSGAEIMATYSDIIADALARLESAFDRLPQAPLEVRQTETASGAAYSPPAVDGSRPGIFWAPAGGFQFLYPMRTLTYHETVPGHHLQLALALETPTNLFQRIWSNTSFSEGWALYAERLAEELGWYAAGPGGEPADPYGDLGRLQNEMLRAVRLVVDSGIHARGWSFEQAAAYMRENIGYASDDPYVEDEIGRYAMWPAQAAAYKVGMLAILDLRERERERLGAQFDLKGFHDQVLGQGNLPISVLQGAVGRSARPRSRLAAAEAAPPAPAQISPRARAAWNPLRAAVFLSAGSDP